MTAWTLPIVAALLMAYGAFSARLRTTVVSRAMIFLASGLLLGSGLQVIDVGAANQVVSLLAEATLVLVLFTDASVVSLGGLRRWHTLPARLLGIALPLTIGAGTLAALAVFPQLSVWEAAALATILAPTDAALGLPVITNERVPLRIREGLNVESGLNDGICVPLLIIFLTIAESGEGVAHVEPVRVIVEEIGYGLLGGAVAGAVGAVVLRTFLAKRWMSGSWRQINAVTTPLLAYTATDAMGGSGFVAAFVAGLIYSAVAGPHITTPSTLLAKESGELLNAVTFLVFGAVLLAPALSALDWRVAVYAVASLTAVRMVPVALALLGTSSRAPTVGFLGWFGPRGLASIVFVLILVERTELAGRDLIVDVVTWTVTLSVLAHGLTARPAASRYATWHTAQTVEHKPDRRASGSFLRRGGGGGSRRSFRHEPP